MKLRRGAGSSIAAMVLAAASCGCGRQAVVDLTIDVDPSVSADVVAAVRSVELDVSGLFTRMDREPLARPFAAGGSERIVILSPLGGDVTLDVSALDETGTPLLAGATTFTLRTGATLAQSVTLHRAESNGDDGGVAADLGAVADLAAPPGSDLAVGPIVCPNNVLLCDGFEGGSVSATLWNGGTTQSNSTVTVDQTHVHRGQYALHVHTNIVASGSAEASIAETNTFSPPGATFWARAFYYFPSNASAAAATLLDAVQTTTPNHDVTLAIDHDALAIYNALNGGTYVASTTPKVPLDAWVCLEWQVDTGTPNQLHAWLNGQPVTTLDLMQTTTATPQLGMFAVGIGIFPPNTSSVALDLWIDDVIFDHAPIGCAK